MWCYAWYCMGLVCRDIRHRAAADDSRLGLWRYEGWRESWQVWQRFIINSSIWSQKNQYMVTVTFIYKNVINEDKSIFFTQYYFKHCNQSNHSVLTINHHFEGRSKKERFEKIDQLVLSFDDPVKRTTWQWKREISHRVVDCNDDWDQFLIDTVSYAVGFKDRWIVYRLKKR